jgi:short-subunit dehydrogenase
MKRMKDRVVVIAGASSGVGRVAAEGFAAQGATVVLIARRRGALLNLAAQCRRSARAVLIRAADPADAEAMAGVAADVVTRFGRIDVWVNNASVGMFNPLEQISLGTWRKTVETNLFNTYDGVRAVLPRFRERGAGGVINVASVLSRGGSPFRSAYSASTNAMRAVSDCLRQELADTPGIKVSTVLPGPIGVPIVTQSEPDPREPAPLRPVIDVRRAARAVVTCARMPRREVVVGSAAQSASLLARLLPQRVERYLEGLGRKDRLMDHLPPTIETSLILPRDLLDGDREEPGRRAEAPAAIGSS